MPELYSVGADGTVVLSVYVQPSASRAGVVGRHGDSLKVRVSAPPEAGKANRAVTRLLAAELGVPRHDIELVQGASSRSKRFRLRNLDQATLRKWLAQVRR